MHLCTAAKTQINASIQSFVAHNHSLVVQINLQASCKDIDLQDQVSFSFAEIVPLQSTLLTGSKFMVHFPVELTDYLQAKDVISHLQVKVGKHEPRPIKVSDDRSSANVEDDRAVNLQAADGMAPTALVYNREQLYRVLSELTSMTQTTFQLGQDEQQASEAWGREIIVDFVDPGSNLTTLRSIFFLPSESLSFDQARAEVYERTCAGGRLCLKVSWKVSWQTSDPQADVPVMREHDHQWLHRANLSCTISTAASQTFRAPAYFLEDSESQIVCLVEEPKPLEEALHVKLEVNVNFQLDTEVAYSNTEIVNEVANVILETKVAVSEANQSQNNVSLIQDLINTVPSPSGNTE